MIFVVYCENQDSTTGVDFTGIFDTKIAAENFAKSEGPYYMVAETGFGTIDWKVFNPIVVNFDWGNIL